MTAINWWKPHGAFSVVPTPPTQSPRFRLSRWSSPFPPPFPCVFHFGPCVVYTGETTTRSPGRFRSLPKTHPPLGQKENQQRRNFVLWRSLRSFAGSKQHLIKRSSLSLSPQTRWVEREAALPRSESWPTSLSVRRSPRKASASQLYGSWTSATLSAATPRSSGNRNSRSRAARSAAGFYSPTKLKTPGNTWTLCSSRLCRALRPLEPSFVSLLQNAFQVVGTERAGETILARSSHPSPQQCLLDIKNLKTAALFLPFLFGPPSTG